MLAVIGLLALWGVFLAVSPAGAADDNAYKLRQLEQRLESLKTKYTDQHPDVIRVQRMIDYLKSQPDAVLSVPVLPEAKPAATPAPGAGKKAAQADRRKTPKKPTASEVANSLLGGPPVPQDQPAAADTAPQKPPAAPLGQDTAWGTSDSSLVLSVRQREAERTKLRELMGIGQAGQALPGPGATTSGSTVVRTKR
ncbi:MAG: hypothetical protein KQJ78_19710 [Deltaproteobacteria bacterium]|nr:hypothetical protein [Deltaproteobacteria bacterium]